MATLYLYTPTIHAKTHFFLFRRSLKMCDRSKAAVGNCVIQALAERQHFHSMRSQSCKRQGGSVEYGREEKSERKGGKQLEQNLSRMRMCVDLYV